MRPVRSLARWAAYAVLALPLAVAPVAVRMRVPRRRLREPIRRRGITRVRIVAHSVLSAGVGLLAWFLVFLAVVALVRGLGYPLVAADDYENSWGGPTLAGAWAVHAALGVGLLPVWLAALAGLGALQLRLIRQLFERAGPAWPVPAALVLAIAGVFFFLSWLSQA
ncbi:hypothetical protein [Nocardia bhagyanarayanae]|uniref:Uncharacterized protein n=1 Tax=Nocardia bhagyanarayanae TaxID=1215925 RepID=A0A543FH57_9NOCA|nr:hypothetical protein [Nocardia bhagyanarayanae]TQM33106.1 hypothetical protein FB390_4820 [Nocardia bhagyanarayanae]